MLGIALDVWRGIYGVGATFNPASLFAGGELGLWHDPSDIATLYQDSAGTTPVTAVTQPVGKELDKSGRVNHALQATSGARPTYNSASGVKFLTFDGVDDALSTGAITLSADMDCFIAFRRNSSTSMIIFTRVPAGGDYFGTIVDGDGNGSSSGVGFPTYAVNGVDVNGGAISATRGQIAAAIPVGAWVVLEVRNLDLSIWLQFCTSTYPSFEFNGDIGGIILCPAQTTEKRNQIRTYLGAKVGLTL